MRCIFSTSSNPYFNLATEDFFLKNSDEEHFLIYINEPCIVVGKHQNLLAEINIRFALENNIKLARRISGGGTVYQDSNNLNFSFIHNCNNLEKLNFKKFTYPVFEALKNMGLEVEFSERNDLLIESKKISGNAMHIFKNRVLSHGTLLFNANLSQLSAALKNSPQRYIDKSIKSVRSKVTNLSNYTDNGLSMSTFAKSIFENITHKYVNANQLPLSDQEIQSILKMATEKYETWDWIYGYSPRYLFQNSFELSDLEIKFEFQVEKGIIRSQNSNIDLTRFPVYHHAFEILTGVQHDPQIIYELLEKNSIINSSPTFNIKEFCNNLF